MYENVIGKFCLVRCLEAGVHMGMVKSAEGRACYLEKARRMDRFKCAQGDSLSAVALYGIDPSFDGNRIQGEVSILLTENCEIIPMTDEALATFGEVPEYVVK